MNAFAIDSAEAMKRVSARRKREGLPPWWRRVQWDMAIFWTLMPLLSGFVVGLIVRSWLGWLGWW